jgi:hypothetical protein
MRRFFMYAFVSLWGDGIVAAQVLQTSRLICKGNFSKPQRVTQVGTGLRSCLLYAASNAGEKLARAVGVY